MSRADNTAYPLYDAGQQMEGGLTIREHFAAMAMQGLVAYYGASQFQPDVIAEWARKRADALIAELAKPVQS